MQEFYGRKPVLTGTDSTARPGDFPIGSAQSRAAARSKLESFGREIAPNISVVFYEPGERSADGTLGPPVRVEANRTTVDGGNKPPFIVDRRLDESLDAFEKRVAQIMSDSRGRGKPRVALFDRVA
jgi:hypothetical protein